MTLLTDWDWPPTARLLALLLFVSTSFLPVVTPRGQPLEGTRATVYLHPTNFTSRTPCDVNLAWDLGCNYWLLRNQDWSTYQRQRTSDWAMAAYSLGNTPRSAAIIYFPLYAATTNRTFLGEVLTPPPLERLSVMISDAVSAGLMPMLLLGRPEFYISRTGTLESHDPVHDMDARAKMLEIVARILQVQAVQTHVTYVSLYWMGAYCTSRGSAFCSEAEIMQFNTALQSAIHAASPPLPASPYRHLLHLDGPFWEACWPQPCTNWTYGGYSPASIANMNGIMAETWVQGSLLGGVQRLFSQNVVTRSNLMLLDDIPNCDLYPATSPCATGSLEGDVSTWEGWMNSLGMNSTWGVWSFADGTSQSENAYGDVVSNGTVLTRKGQLHRARALRAFLPSFPPPPVPHSSSSPSQSMPPTPPPSQRPHANHNGGSLSSRPLTSLLLLASIAALLSFM